MEDTYKQKDMNMTGEAFKQMKYAELSRSTAQAYMELFIVDWYVGSAGRDLRKIPADRRALVKPYLQFLKTADKETVKNIRAEMDRASEIRNYYKDLAETIRERFLATKMRVRLNLLNRKLV